MRRLGVLGVALPLLVAFTVAKDPNDVRGKLDLRKVTAAREEPLLRMNIITYGVWRSRLLRGAGGPHAGPNKLTVLYDVNGDKRADYTGRIIYEGTRLALWITGKKSQFEPVPVRRPTRRSVTFRHPVDIFFKGSPRDVEVIWIRVTSLYRKAGTACARGCRDRAPNRAWMKIVFRQHPPAADRPG